MRSEEENNQQQFLKWEANYSLKQHSQALIPALERQGQQVQIQQDTQGYVDRLYLKPSPNKKMNKIKRFSSLYKKAST